jgi:hypothetical protein
MNAVELFHTAFAEACPTSATDWDNAEAQELGAANMDYPWISTDRDVWHKNPNYFDIPWPHPEYCDDENKPLFWFKFYRDAETTTRNVDAHVLCYLKMEALL